MHNKYEVLNNPVWNALQTTHKAFAQGTANVKRYPQGVLQFVGCATPGQCDLNEIIPWTSAGEKLIMIGELPTLPANWSLVRELDCTQMISEQSIPVAPDAGSDVIALTAADIQDMLALINLVQPGFFFENTPALGSYYGIRREGQLVAIAGERTRITGLTEVSGVCTHPSFTGRGFAQQLVTHIVNRNIARDTALYLHLLTSNDRARKVYELLGFRETRPIPFWEICRNA
jgi:GNAT superfamily N-acetyltransferase